MKLRGHWEWRTARGTIAIVPDEKGCFDLQLDGQIVGNYHRAKDALRNAAAGAVAPSGLSTADLKPPPGFDGWTFVP